MAASQTLIKCANCRREQPDYGKGATCDFCWCSPLPSYKYPKTAKWHPDNCNGKVGTTKLPFRVRTTKR